MPFTDLFTGKLNTTYYFYIWIPKQFQAHNDSLVKSSQLGMFMTMVNFEIKDCIVLKI